MLAPAGWHYRRTALGRMMGGGRARGVVSSLLAAMCTYGCTVQWLGISTVGTRHDEVWFVSVPEYWHHMRGPDLSGCRGHCCPDLKRIASYMQSVRKEHVDPVRYRAAALYCTCSVARAADTPNLPMITLACLPGQVFPPHYSRWPFITRALNCCTNGTATLSGARQPVGALSAARRCGLPSSGYSTTYPYVSCRLELLQKMQM